MNAKKIFIMITSLSLLTGCTFSKSKDKSGYNETDMAQYAALVNQLAVENNMSAFLWDCSVHLDRKNLKIKYPKYVQAIMDAYASLPQNTGNGKNNSAFEEESSYDAVKNFRAGWNLGNTLDSNSYSISNETAGEKGWILQYGEKDSSEIVLPSVFETAWGQPVTTQKIADFVISSGFNAIRVPVTWAEHLDSENNIDSSWMARVKETVDYFYNRGVYVILNVHHDGGENGWIQATQFSWDNYNTRFSKIWTQIATTFKDYDERLLFESMNEVLDGKATWGAVTDTSAAYINKYNQLFVDSVRATGGNNEKRNLVVMTYCGGGGEQWFSTFTVPTDTIGGTNHIILEIHNYDPTAFTWTTATWTTMTAIWDPVAHGNILKNEFAVYKKWSEKLGVPFIVGEYCADPKKYSDYDN